VRFSQDVTAVLFDKDSDYSDEDSETSGGGDSRAGDSDRSAASDEGPLGCRVDDISLVDCAAEGPGPDSLLHSTAGFSDASGFSQQQTLKLTGQVTDRMACMLCSTAGVVGMLLYLRIIQTVN
jgi:hypothetical protein